MQTRELGIPTTQGHILAATEFVPERSNQKTMIISSATGVLQGYYHKFARYFSTLGYVVYTFDYWGIGKSGGKIDQLKENKFDLKNWGFNDQAAMVAFAREKHPEYELVLLTHSVGGQIVGFNPQYREIDKIVMVASQSGYWRYFEGIHQPKMILFWYAMIPFLTPIYGYFPAKKLGLFENLPKEMAYEWKRWGKRARYMMHFYDKNSYFFDRIEAPVLSLSFPRDEYAPQKAVDWLTAQFTSSNTERLHYQPHRSALGKLRHFGFFRERFKEELWDLTDRWIRKTSDL
ncbi:alpha/beta hydrolase family protein [Poritiphilus flavus]|uniref:Hydrolase n=1 Tax=Poritiphilus flavus TaxID=2697053 RepID=A0A6L9E8I2_9FLAO|nr:alpha/beta fold hydrolase [Poritiphilus flavus]NAS11087.1 hydrolase [Poritiphilus flavus]